MFSSNCHRSFDVGWCHYSITYYSPDETFITSVITWRVPTKNTKYLQSINWTEDQKKFHHSLTHSVSPLRLPPSARHLTLFWAVRLTSCHVCRLSSNSSLLVRLQLCWDMLFLCFPCGFFLWLCIRLVSSVWTIHPQALCLMSFSTSRCFAYLQRYSLHIRLPHQILGLLLHEHLMPLPQSLGQPSSFRTIREHNRHISPREFHLDFNCQRLRPSNWPQHSKCLSCLFNT